MQAAFREGSLPLDLASDTEVAAMGLYVIETAQRFVFGQRLLTVDGRVFKYGHAIGDLLAGFGAANIAPQNLMDNPTVVVGDRTIAFTVESTMGYAAGGLIAKDELIGGYLVIGHGTSKVQNFMITGNTACQATSDADTIVELDHPITIAGTLFSEIVLNPYRYLSKGSLEYNAFMCVPAMNCAATYNFWGQTWGPCWVTPGGGDTTPGSTVDDRTAFFVGDGTVNFGNVIVSAARGHQQAGFAIETTSGSLTALPLLMLQISI